MNIRKNHGVVAGCLLCLPLLAWAEAGSQIGGHASTLGFGVDASWGVSEHVGVRLTLNTMRIGNFHYFIQDEGVPMNDEYQGDWQFANGGLLADWFPWAGVVHLTAGLYYNNNRYSGTAPPGSLGGNRNYQFNGNTYNSGTFASLSPRIDFERKVAPYIGLGWSGRTKGGLSFTSDIGVLVQGSPRVTVEAQGWATGTDMVALQRDAAQAISNQITNTKLYPVVSIGFAYGF